MKGLMRTDLEIRLSYARETTYMHAQSLLSCLTLWPPWTVAHQAPLSMGFSRQEYWSGMPCPLPGDLPNPGIEPTPPASPTLQADSLPLSHQRNHIIESNLFFKSWKLHEHICHGEDTHPRGSWLTSRVSWSRIHTSGLACHLAFERSQSEPHPRGSCYRLWASTVSSYTRRSVNYQSDLAKRFLRYQWYSRHAIWWKNTFLKKNVASG